MFKTLCNVVVGRILSQQSAKRKIWHYVKMWFGAWWKIVLWIVWFLCQFNYFNYNWEQWYGYTKGARCSVPEDEMEDLRNLGRTVQDVLESAGVTYFLLYGSLWGALRIGDILPWDNDIDMGINKDDMKVPIDDVVTALQAKDLSARYNTNGAINVFSKSKFQSRVDIMLFSDWYSTGTMHRIGWETYIFPLYYRTQHSFPYQLIKRPLDTIDFIGRKWPAPHGGKEIMKYHYPRDYWKETKPEGC